MPKIKPLYVFKSDFISSYEEFFNSHYLKQFLKEVDFLSTGITRKFKCLPEFRLGTRFFVEDYGEIYKSNIIWGPKFLVGYRVRTDSKGRMFVLVPMDVTLNCEDSNCINVKYQEIRFYRGMADAVFDINNLRQIWPKREINQNEFIKYLAMAEKLKKINSKIREVRNEY